MLELILNLVLVYYAQQTPGGPGRDWVHGQSGKANFWLPLAKNSVFHPDAKAKRSQLIQDRWVAFGDMSQKRCPMGMALAKGQMRDPEENRRRQNSACLDAAAWKPGVLCQHFNATLLGADTQKHQALEFCVDLFEFPNVPDEYPATMVSWQDALVLCQAQGKRLCSEDEWTFACEGVKGWPYPHGHDRYVEKEAHFPDRVPHAEGCNQDHLKLVRPDMAAVMAAPFTFKAVVEIDKSWRGMKAGEAKKCVSSWGVFDLTGNVEEWTVQSKGRPRNFHGAPSVLKGGYWAPVQARCQMAELAHGPAHRYYQTGFRCCSNVILK